MTAATEKVLAAIEERVRRVVGRRGKAADPIAELAQAMVEATVDGRPVPAEVEADLRARARALGVSEEGFETVWQRATERAARRNAGRPWWPAARPAAAPATTTSTVLTKAEPEPAGEDEDLVTKAAAPEPEPAEDRRPRRVPGEDGVIPGSRRKESDVGWRRCNLFDGW